MKKIASLFILLSVLIFLSSCIEYVPVDETIIVDPTVVPTDPIIDPTDPIVDPTIDPVVIPPVIYDFLINAGSDTVEIHTDWIDMGAYLSLETEDISVLSTDVVDTSVLGTFTINYTLTQGDVTYSATRMVIVIDQTPPQLTLNPGIDSIKLGETWIDGYVTVSDNSLDDVTIVVSGTVNSNQVGQYFIVYEATDSSGNTSRITRIVTVYE